MSSSGVSESTIAVRRPGWRERLRAWWHGHDLPAEPLDEAPSAAAVPAADLSADLSEPTIRAWPPMRQAVAQAVFGDGLITPGGEEAVHRLLKPLGLNERMTVIELGAGLGGITRLMAREFKLWATGFEADPVLAAAAMELSTKAGLAKKAVIKCQALDRVDVRAGTVDCAVAKESLWLVADKPGLFAHLRRLLKPTGQISFSDFMHAGDPQAPDLAGWAAGEPFAPHLISAADYRKLLEDRKLEVRVMEDVTAEYSQSVLAAFAAHADHVKAHGAEPAWRAWVVSEGELWGRRLAALQSGALRVYRCYARATGGSGV